MVVLIVAIVLVLIAMVGQFIQPELVYGVRRFLVEFRIHRVTLDSLAGKSGGRERFLEALVDDGRSRSAISDVAGVRKRLNKLKELYRLLSQLQDIRIATGEGAKKHKKTQRTSIVLVELSDLIGNLANRLTDSPEFDRATVSSEAMLAEVANKLRGAMSPDENRLSQLQGHGQITEWFRDNPISVEQASELLIAVADALTLRIEAQESSRAARKVERTRNLPSSIIILERKLRSIVRARYLSISPEGSQGDDRIRQLLGDHEFNQCVGKMRRNSGKENGGLSTDVLEYTTFPQLERLIQTDWEEFESALGPREWFGERVGKIMDARNDIFHSREIPDDRQRSIEVAIDEIETRLAGRAIRVTRMHV